MAALTRHLKLLLMLSLLVGPLGDAVCAAHAPILLGGEDFRPIGRSTVWVAERERRLTVEEASMAYRHGAFSPGRKPVLTFGIGADPVWIRFAVQNPAAEVAWRRISIEAGWIDRIEIFIRQEGTTVATFRAGDRLPFEERSIDTHGFAFDYGFTRGVSEVFLRVQTPDAMVVPIHLERLEQTARRQERLHYSYGFLYGFLFALLAYNVMLFVGLRESRYLLYSVYLGMFVLLNLSYTGHAFAWFWPDSPIWAQWSHPTLMVLYASAGLAFALDFLKTRRRFPRLYRLVIGYIATGCMLLAVFTCLQRQRDALLLAFTFVSLFSLIMVVLGTISARAGVKAARYFLAASVCAMAGAASTTLAVWGVIPFTALTYRAVDIGMLIDATLLALALTYQFREVQEKRVLAEEMARLDPLTGLNNRRAFCDLSMPIWNLALRHGRDLSVILLDIDSFKRVNDCHGHAAGDGILKAVAEVLSAVVRKHDVVARWGGEEFILLLPETSLSSAAALAERLRQNIALCRVMVEGEAVGVTASLGVAHRTERHHNLENLIGSADRGLYEAKASGRNCVVAAREEVFVNDGA